ncbi:MAG: zinc ribbon domain-containing protein [Simkaniaceae bacterium]
MHKSIKKILEIQEFDIKMIQLMRIKRQRQKELAQIDSLRKDLRNQLTAKEEEIDEISLEITSQENLISENTQKMKALDERQSSVKKVEEFNALTHEMTTVERQKQALENQVSDLYDRKLNEEEVLEKVKESLTSTEASSKELEAEIRSSITSINVEGSKLKESREALAKEADEHTLSIYERLLRNKKDRVVVPIESRSCSGCHISLTPQHENLVRKGENLVFCEHCSRIHYWQDLQEPTESGAKTTRRRRRAASV